MFLEFPLASDISRAFRIFLHICVQEYEQLINALVCA